MDSHIVVVANSQQDSENEKEVVNRSGINSELFRIVSEPPDWVTKSDEDSPSPYFLTKHLDILKSFLDATTDSIRLVRASEASYAILEESDMADLEDLRATVQASEMLRVIPYPRQTDHSAHTLYLYLLGIYLYFACKPLRVEIEDFLRDRKRRDPVELLKRFLFQWTFVSLLHDIGYIFQGRSGNEIRAVDRMFRASKVKSLVSPNLRQGISDALTDIKIEPFEQIQNPEDMLSLLRFMPWGGEAGFEKDIFEEFDQYMSNKNQQITSNDLEDYAYRVASSGYDGFSEGTVDHAVASGLFLFRYSTFWFWLAKRCKYKEELGVYRDDYQRADVTRACFAAAAHNIIGVHAKGLDPLNFATNPLVYLGILCDELQKWDRFPAGERHIADLKSFEKYCTDSERIIVKGTWDGEKVDFVFEEEELAASIKKALGRLDATENFIRINPPADDEVSPASDDNAGVTSDSTTPPGANPNNSSQPPP